MKVHLNTDKELVNTILQGLKNNNGYCPCIYQSNGKQEYKCICKDMRENVPVGETCHCGLYIKDTD